MSVNHVRPLSDGEELILVDGRGLTTFVSSDADPGGAFFESADPREASFERRSQALSDTRRSDPSSRGESLSHLPAAVE